MAANPEEMEQIPSLFDRLTVGESEEAQLRFRQDANRPGEITKSVCRDLANLLNSKRSWLTWPAHCEQLQRSLLNYGLPDFTGAIFAGPTSQADLCRQVEELIEIFEPRLTRVRVFLPKVAEGPIRAVEFKIRATLVFEGRHETVEFQSKMEPGTQVYRVEAGGA
ncbi:MAG: type VI secretion system baseplate subunit TssE [Planctomycetota bacterium]|nr:type VI secretion system baseplate subunit TssE [Planctomycetota bacterium]